MRAEHSPLAHHFENLAQQRSAASLGMWLFLLTEIMFFGGLFLGYLVARVFHPEAFGDASHHLDVVLGTVNTVVLIGSSLTMALAVHAAESGSRSGVRLFLLATMALALVFLAIKGVEYTHKYHEHHVPGLDFVYPGPFAIGARLFFSLYFMMTGLHALHMVVGLGLMVWLLVLNQRGRFTPAYSAPVEIMGLYWHFVDIIWIFLFPLLYLIGRH